ncbi:YigZ family protein [Porphyromonadaceae bacterium OttesenSCG-928-L07]|nr:YigZ family protein [Porphyromonadaceae bacterium OttesenSCG-928-L07]MDL2251952.1 YigZ family protein [Odoribacter sp. OttesenSCG-928-J03]MDL2283283.1 YigZ family protein [Odoribacter sp. OttesenSCG-928-G04]
MDDVYKTIELPAEGIYKEKGSKFISFIYPVRNEEEIKTIVSGLKEKYYDARHHCYAYMLGADKKVFRMNDDGEPSSTAGKPILGQILSHDLTQVLIVVVRYFGGTKLGVSGLISAYKDAAADAIANAVIVEKTVDTILHITFSYLVMNDVMRIIKEENPEVLERDFSTECNMTLSIRNKLAENLMARLNKVESLSLEIC